MAWLISAQFKILPKNCIQADITLTIKRILHTRKIQHPALQWHFFFQYQCHPPTPQKPEGLKAFTWPPKSQDPNPIEHPGNALDQALSVKAPLSNPQSPKDPLPMPDTRNCSTPPEVSGSVLFCL